MTHRIIDGLDFAGPCVRPATIPIGRPRGVKALGVRYEKSLAEAIPFATRGQWWSSTTRTGSGIAKRI